MGVKVDVYDTKVDADRQKGLNLYAGQKKQLVIGLGFNFLDPVKSTAFQYPGTKFAVVDALPSGANTAGLTFREQEGSFMVGVHGRPPGAAPAWWASWAAWIARDSQVRAEGTGRESRRLRHESRRGPPEGPQPVRRAEKA
ncbi:hypothetical protein CTI14_39810, partial [Methylobacterium radiotolerans]